MNEFRSSIAAQMPDGWIGKESLTLLAPDVGASVIVSSEPLHPMVDTEEYAEEQGRVLRDEFPGYKEIAFSPGLFFGGPFGCCRAFSWNPAGGVRVEQIQLYSAKNGRGYVATATGFSALEEVLMDILSSIAF